MKLILKKSVYLPCTNDKMTEKVIGEAMLFLISSSNMKYFEVTLMKQVQDTYEKNIKFLMKKLKIPEDGKIFCVYAFVGLI